MKRKRAGKRHDTGTFAKEAQGGSNNVKPLARGGRRLNVHAIMVFVSALVVSLATLGSTLSFPAHGGLTHDYPAIHPSSATHTQATPPSQTGIASPSGAPTLTSVSNVPGRAQTGYASKNTYSKLLSTDNQDIGFTGYVKDTESGLYYAKARYYDPRVGRFITQDPEEGNPMQPPSLHRYLYAYANPTIYTDPTGRCGQGDEDFCTMNAGLALGWPDQQIQEELKIQHSAEAQASGEAYGTTKALGKGLFGLAKFGTKLIGAAFEVPGSETVFDDARHGASQIAASVRAGPVGLVDYLADVSVDSERLAEQKKFFEAGEVFGDRDAALLALAAPGLRYVGPATRVAGLESKAVTIAEGASGDVAVVPLRKPPVNLADVDSEFGPLNRQSNLAETNTPAVLRDTKAGRLIPDEDKGVRAYPDGSLRTSNGKFASAKGLPAPGTSNAAAYAEFLRSNGVNVVGTELEVNGPLGVRKYDIVTRNPDGSLFGIEIKSGGATPTVYQRFSDRYVNMLGASGRGRIKGEKVTGAYTVYLPSGG